MGKEHELIHAVKTGDVSYVRKALQKYRSSHKHKKNTKKSNINIPDSDGFTILHHAALNGNVEVIMALIEMEADPNARDKKGMCPLHMAAWAGKDQGVKSLLESNALVNLPSFNGETALHLGSQHGYASVVDFLLRYKADPTIRNSSLETPLDLACQYGHTAVVRQLLTNEKVVGMLKGRHDDPRYKSPLHLASKSGHVEIVRLLIESGGDVNEETSQGTCLHHAALYGKTEVVRLLLEAGADVNVQNKNKMTPLDIVNKFTTSRAGVEIKQMLREAAGERIVYARAISNYNNIYDASCLAFKAGDTITVLEQNEDGRWKGCLMTDNEEKIGYFPAQSVTVISDRRLTPTSSTSRASAASIESSLSNSSDKENKTPKQNSKKAAANSGAKAVGVVPIGSYEVLTLATGGPTGQKQRPVNIPRMSSFKRATPPTVHQKPKSNEQAANWEQRRNTEGSNLERPEPRDHRAMTYDVVSPKPRHAPAPDVSQLAQAVQQAVESRRDREEGYAITSSDSSARNYAEVVVAQGQMNHSTLPTTADYTQVYVSGETGHMAISPQSSVSDSSNSPRQHMYQKQPSNDSRNLEEVTEGYEYMKLEQPPPVPAKVASRTPDEKRKLKNAMRTGYVDMNVRNSKTEEDTHFDAPALPKKRSQLASGSEEEPQDVTSLKRIESRGVRNRQESYENFSPRIVPVATHNPFSGGLSGSPTRADSTSSASRLSPSFNSSSSGFHDFAPPYENFRPHTAVPIVPAKPFRHSYENVKPPGEAQTWEREHSVGQQLEPIPLPPKTQQRSHSNQELQRPLHSPLSADSARAVNPFVDTTSLSPSDQRVLDWLSEQKLACYFENFQSAGFDMVGITGLTPEDLTAIGIVKAGHRKKLLSEVTKLDPPTGLPAHKPDDVSTWLSLIRMEQYEENFIEGGFDDIDFIKDLDRNDLEMIEIRNRGHQRKLLLAVKRLAQLELTASLDKIVDGPVDSRLSSSGSDNQFFDFPPPPPFPSTVPPPPPLDEFDDIDPMAQRENLPPPPGAESLPNNQLNDYHTSKEKDITIAVTKPVVPLPAKARPVPSVTPKPESLGGMSKSAGPLQTAGSPPLSLEHRGSSVPEKPPRSPHMQHKTRTLPPPKPKPKPVNLKGQVQTAAEYHGVIKASPAKGMVFIGPSINDSTPDSDVTVSKSRDFWKQTSGDVDHSLESGHPRISRAASASGVKPIIAAKPPLVMPKPKRRNTESEVIRSRSSRSPDGRRSPIAVEKMPVFSVANSHSEFNSDTAQMNAKKMPPPAPPRKESITADVSDDDDVFSSSAHNDRNRTISGPLDEKIKAAFKKSSSSSSEEKTVVESKQEKTALEKEPLSDDPFKETDVLMADIDNLIADFSTQLESMF